jgi:hypothetical protein
MARMVPLIGQRQQSRCTQPKQSQFPEITTEPGILWRGRRTRL